MDDASYMKCFEGCKALHKNVSNADLIKLIQKKNCGTFSEDSLNEKFSRLGLVNMLCGCLCGDEKNGDDDGVDEVGGPPTPELILAPPVGNKKNA
jgi:hypothetical protein